jgi:hypothetical protein
MEGEIKEDRNPGGQMGEQREPGHRGQRFDALCSRQPVMERSSSTGFNQIFKSSTKFKKL